MADFNEEIEVMQAESLKQLEKDIAAKSVKPLEEDVVLQKYSERLNELRKDGVHKIVEGRQNIAVAKKNRMLDKEARAKLIEEYNRQIAEAKIVAGKNKVEADELTKKAVAYANIVSDAYIKQVNEEQSSREQQLTNDYKKRIAGIQGETKERISKLS